GDPPMYPVDGGVYPGKGAKKAAGRGMITQGEAELIARTAAAEAKVELLEKMPMGPVNGRRPMAFDVGKVFGTVAGNGVDALLEGVDTRAIGSGDEMAHTAASARLIGNFLTKGAQGRSILDPEFRGGVAGVKSN